MAANSESNESAAEERAEVRSGAGASYTPDANINPFAYGKDGGKASFANPPSVTVIDHSVSQAPPAMPAVLKIGDNKNVSTPVSG